jgi:hypothetical protein
MGVEELRGADLSTGVEAWQHVKLTSTNSSTVLLYIFKSFPKT